MRHFATMLFVLVGLVNLLPAVGILGAASLESLYSLPLAGDDLLLLMRHRAALLGVLGGFIIVAAFRPHLRAAAAIAGLISMLTFIALALPPDVHGGAVQRVFWVDVIASALLLLGFWASTRNRSAPRPE
jgi:hypothetical protein